MTFRVTDLMLEAVAVGKSKKPKKGDPATKPPACGKCTHCTPTGVSTCETVSDECNSRSVMATCDETPGRTRKQRLELLEAQLDELLAEQAA
jgi:hypothetical protein